MSYFFPLLPFMTSCLPPPIDWDDLLHCSPWLCSGVPPGYPAATSCSNLSAARLSAWCLSPAPTTSDSTVRFWKKGRGILECIRWWREDLGPLLISQNPQQAFQKIPWFGPAPHCHRPVSAVQIALPALLRLVRRTPSLQEVLRP